jgi:hypothetical protein
MKGELFIMEGQETAVQTGVENTPAAEVQTETNTQTETSTQQPTGVQTDSAAGNQGVEQAFARRLASERQKIEQEFSPYRSFVETEAKRNNMTSEQWLQAVEQQRQAEERQNYINQGINPDLVNKLIESNPEVQYARQMRAQQEEQSKFQTEANEFFQTFPDVKVEEISPAVYQLKAEKGLSLTDAYLRVNFSSLKVKSEQEVIAKMQANSQSSPGSLSQGGEPPKTDIGHMNKTDFESLVARVKRGEKIQI